MTIQTINSNNESTGATSVASRNPAQIGVVEPHLETPVAIESDELVKLRAISVNDQEERVENLPAQISKSPNRHGLLAKLLAPLEIIDGWLGGPVLTKEQRAESARYYAKTNFHKLGANGVE